MPFEHRSAQLHAATGGVPDAESLLSPSVAYMSSLHIAFLCSAVLLLNKGIDGSHYTATLQVGTVKHA
jgi:hypothetical protein